MVQQHSEWRSRALKRRMEISIFGLGGEAMLVFPTSGGRHSEFSDRGMPQVLAEPIESGALQLFCLDTVNSDSWYNKRRRPATRVRMQVDYERYIVEEVIPYIRTLNPSGPLGALGTSLGGYHAMNLALRHPGLVTHCLTLGGAFDIRRFLAGYTDYNAFEQNPFEYVPALDPGPRLDACRRLRIVMAVGERDFLAEENRRFSALLHEKSIPHTLDVWGHGAEHDWPWWQRMAAKHLP